MPDFKKMIEGMKEQETLEAPTQEKQDTYTDKQGKQVKVLGITESGKRIIPYKDWKRHVGGEKGVKKRVEAWIGNQTKKEAPMAEEKHKENRFDELSKTWKDKPHKVFNGKEYYVRPYTDLAGNRFYDINSKKQGEDFGLGSASGYEFKTEDEARKTIDEWEGYHRKKTDPKKLDFVSKNLDAILDHGIKDEFAKKLAAEIKPEYSNLPNDAIVLQYANKHGIQPGDMARWLVENDAIDEDEYGYWEDYLRN